MDPGPNPPVVRGSEQRDAAIALAIEHRRNVRWVAVLPGTLLLMVAGATGGWVNKARTIHPRTEARAPAPPPPVCAGAALGGMPGMGPPAPDRATDLHRPSGWIASDRIAPAGTRR